MKCKFMIAAFSVAMLISSCMKEEPLFKEADIESLSLSDSVFVDAVVSDNRIAIMVTDTSSLKRLAPTFTLSSGATIHPASGDSVDFFNGKAIYTVTSEDKMYQKKYEISIVPYIALKNNFDNWIVTGGLWKYYTPKDNLWISANKGIQVAMLGRLKDYPTRPTDDCVSGGNAALLETLKGGRFMGQHIPIFAGSLYRGRFELNSGNAKLSTLFGQIHPQYLGKPLRLVGYYKYIPGEIFTDENGAVVENMIDSCSIYAIKYKVAKGDVSKESYLTAMDIFTSPNIVAKAILKDGSAKEAYKKFEIPFEYLEQPNYDLYDYRLAVVFSSSKRGDSYQGAVGSKLFIDEVEVICDKYRGK